MKNSEAHIIKKAKIERYSHKKTVEEYYSERFYEPIGMIRDRVEKKIVLSNVLGRVLDGGCGPGRFSLKLADEKREVVGIDTSWEMLSYASQNSDKKINFTRGNLEDLPFRDNSFDSVISIRVLFHIPDYKNVVKEFLRVLKPNGRIIIQMYSGDENIRQNLFLKWFIQSSLYKWILEKNDIFFDVVRGKRPSKSTYQNRKGPAYDFHSLVSYKECKDFLEKQGTRYFRRYTYDLANSIWFQNRLLRGGGIINFLLSFKLFFWFFYFLEIYFFRFFPTGLSHQYIIVMEKK